MFDEKYFNQFFEKTGKGYSNLFGQPNFRFQVSFYSTFHRKKIDADIETRILFASEGYKLLKRIQ